MRPRTILLLATLLLAVLATTMALATCTPRAIGDVSPSPTATASPTASTSPSPTPTATPTAPPPASSATVSSARLAHRHASHARKRYAFDRWCLGWKAPVALPCAPPRSASDAVWRSFGKRCATLSAKFRRRSRACVARMERPHPLVSAAQWKPLLLYVGWPRSVVTYAVTIIRRESGGRPWATNGFCDGLFQINRCHHSAQRLRADRQLPLRARSVARLRLVADLDHGL